MTNSERTVADHLKSLGIKWSYEQPVFVWDEHKRPRVWTPDFYLNHLGIYLEVCGSKHFNYDFRRKIYEKNGYNVIFVHTYKKTEYWRHHFIKYLQIFSELRNHIIDKILEKKN
jgi:hypothetical protein